MKPGILCLSARALRGLVVVLALAGCASRPAPGPDGIDDPLEPMNRVTHGLNKGIDRMVVRPAASVEGTVLPGPLRRGIGNVAATLDLPGDIANQLLQGRVFDAATNTLRLGANLTLGLGGLVDFASAAGMPRLETDFGETLAVWGVGEGPYLVLPALGPSTLRDALGEVVDIAFDPLGQVLHGRDARAATLLRLLAKIDRRGRHAGTVDSILYESADSYAQLRLLYLQNRRHELGKHGVTGQSAPEAESFDPYEDPYAQ